MKRTLSASSLVLALSVESTHALSVSLGPPRRNKNKNKTHLQRSKTLPVGTSSGPKESIIGPNESIDGRIGRVPTLQRAATDRGPARGRPSALNEERRTTVLKNNGTSTKEEEFSKSCSVVEKSENKVTFDHPDTPEFVPYTPERGPDSPFLSLHQAQLPFSGLFSEFLGVEDAVRLSWVDTEMPKSTYLMNKLNSKAVHKWNPRRLKNANNNNVAETKLVPTTLTVGEQDGKNAIVEKAVFVDSDKILVATTQGAVKIVDAKTGAPMQSLLPETGKLHRERALALSNDKAYIATGTDDGFIRIFDARSGLLIRTLDDHTRSPEWTQINSVAFSNSSSTESKTGDLKNDLKILSSSEDGTARVFSVRTGENLLKSRTRNEAAFFRQALFSNDDSKILTLADDTTVTLWDARTRAPLVDFLPPAAQEEEEGGEVTRVKKAVFSPDNSLVVTVCEHNFSSRGHPSVSVYNAETGALIRKVSMPKGAFAQGLAFSHDGTLLATSTGGMTHLWNVEAILKGTHPESFLVRELGQRMGTANDVHFSPDDSQIIVANRGEGVKIWDYDTVQQTLPPLGRVSSGPARF